MLVRDKIAGCLMAVGAIGLALVPMNSPPAAPEKKATLTSNVTVAITSGSQLHLVEKGGRRSQLASMKVERKMVCSKVFRLPIADLGLHCRAVPAVLAFVKQ